MTIGVDVRLLGKGGRTGIEEYTENVVDEILKLSNDEFLFFYNGMRMGPLPAPWTANKRVRVVNWRIPNKIIDASFRFLKWPEVMPQADIFWSPHFNIIEPGSVPHVM